jgi:hypothetical protein
MLHERPHNVYYQFLSYLSIKNVQLTCMCIIYFYDIYDTLLPTTGV